MRLSTEQQQSILQATRKNFGADANVWLFGSRADDARRGGDVDLYVETNKRNSWLLALHCKIAIEESLDRLAANRMDHKAWQVNGLKPYPWTLLLKPLSKIGQYFKRKKA